MNLDGDLMRRGAISLEVMDLKRTPLLREVLCYQPTVAFVGEILAAEETGICE